MPSREARRNIITAIEAVARTLGNTPAICKKCYVRPIILETYLDGTSIEMLERKAEAKLGRELPRLLLEEVAVLMLLREHLHDKRV